MMASTSNDKESTKPTRSPVERAIVWVVILVGVGVVVLEARAKNGYDAGLAYIQKRVDDYNAAGDTINVPALKLSELKQQLSGGPTLGEPRDAQGGQHARSLKWTSLFKRYELTLIVNTTHDDAIVFNVRPADPSDE